MAGQVEKWSWIAGIAAAIIGLFTFFHEMTEPKNPSLSQSGQGNVQVGSNSGSVVVNQGDEALKLQLPVDIEGDWNAQQARAMALTELKSKASSFSKLESPLVYGFLKASDLVYKDHESKVLSFTTNTEGLDCHACAPYLSFFEFEKRKRGWKLVHDDVAAVQFGAWGSFDASDLSVRVISDNIYGVFLTGGYTAQGVTTQSVSMFARIGDTFRDIFDTETMEENPAEYGGGGWSSTIQIKPVPTGLYDLVVKRAGDGGPNDMRWKNGPDEEKDDIANSDGKIRPLDTFRFDGSRYVRSDLFR